MRRVLILVVVAATAVVAVFWLTRPDTGPTLRFDATVPDDLRAVAVEAWDGFVAAHPARGGCLAPVTVSAAWELDDRAEYRPATATVMIRVPGTAPNLTNDLTHEFAHHMEFTCPEHEELRPAFLVAQGFAATAAWFDGETWETTPSEQYAEATTAAVLGRRTHHGGIFLTEKVINLVREWGSGS